MLKLQASTSVAYIRQIIADEDSILDSVPRLRPADLISRLEVLESQVSLAVEAGWLETTNPLLTVLLVLNVNYTKDMSRCLSTVYEKQ